MLMQLSIIIPAYNEAHKIQKDIKKAEKFLLDHKITGEIIIVDDGSEDDTAKRAKGVEVSDNIEKHIISYRPNRGKGRAVQRGVEHAQGDLILFIDSGSVFNIDDIHKGIDLLKKNECDLAHGSRNQKSSKALRDQGFKRIILSTLFRYFCIFYLKVPKELSDTQCGLKIYKNSIAKKLYRNCIIERSVFDIEIILKGLKKEYRIKEFPVEWQSDPDSRSTFMKTAREVAVDLRKIKREQGKAEWNSQ